MAEIVAAVTLGLSGHQGQDVRAVLKSLNLALFVHAKHRAFEGGLILRTTTSRTFSTKNESIGSRKLSALCGIRPKVCQIMATFAAILSVL